MSTVGGVRSPSVANGVAWAAFTQILSKGSTAVATLVLARLLLPADFGLFAIGTVLINFMDRVKDMGVGAGLIYRREGWERLARTGLPITIVFTGLLAGLAYAIAPAVERVFQADGATELMRVLAVALLISGFAVVPETRLRRALDFRRRLIPETAGAVVKGGVSITLAVMGYGVWSLAWGQVAATLVQTCLYWVFAAWRPRVGWNRDDARHLLRYGVPSASVAVLAVLHENLDYLIIGLRMSQEDLGYYVLAYRIPELVVIGICIVVGQVLFPYFSRMQDDRERLGLSYLRTVRIVSLVTTPLGVLLALLAPQVVETLYSTGWGPTVPVLRILAVFSIVYSMSFHAGEIYKATGRPGILNTIAVVKLLVMTPVLWWATGYSIVMVAAGILVVNVGLTGLKLVVVARVLGLATRRILSSVVPAVAASIGMGLVVAAVGLTLDSLPAPAQLLVLGSVGGLAYLGCLWVIVPDVVRSGVGVLRRRTRSEEVGT